MNRRTFLEVSLAGAAGVLTGGLQKLVAAASTSKSEETFLLGGDLLVNRHGWGALKAAQDAGKIRHVGLSEVTVAEIEQAKKVMPIVSIQNRYNITDRDSEAALNYCQKEKMGFIPWAPIGGSGSRSLSKSGNLLEAEAKRYNVSVVQLALAWLLQKSPVMLPIPGTSSLAHLEENMAAAKLQLSPEEWKRIEGLARQA